MKHESRPNTMRDNSLTVAVLRGTLAEVERDEAEAISLFCRALEMAEESRDFTCFPRLRTALKQWQSVPPRGIVTDLKKVVEELECRVHDKA